MTEPRPGEAWVIVVPQYGTQEWERIHDQGPFVVLYVTTKRIAVVTAGHNTEPSTFFYERGLWDWDEHALRLWPPADPVPSWEQLGHASEPHPDDLRAQVTP